MNLNFFKAPVEQLENICVGKEVKSPNLPEDNYSRIQLALLIFDENTPLK